MFSGGIDNTITAWDLRKQAPVFNLYGHQDTVSGLRLSPDGSYMLSSSMDNTLKMWDIKPFAPADRCIRTFEGMVTSPEKNLSRPCWSNDMERVACGSADRTVLVWDRISGKIKYRLPGHKGHVNEVDWHPTEPIIMSCSSDRNLYLGELEPSLV